MVQAFHAAGIEVWLDVVYNHTAEGDETGPTYSFRGIDNGSYYLLTPDRRHYINDTGCGNTVRTGHPGARVLVLESLRFWARTMGVDGFRFDLASIFSRAADGTMDVHEASLVSEIGLLARLFNVRLVAEAWDIASYQLGRGFPGIGVAAMERQVSRRRAFVRAGRAGQGGRADAAALWQRRSLSRRPAGDASPASERQLRHRARRLLPLRPGGLRPKAQRGQRPRQHGRHRRQPELELRRGRRRQRARSGARVAPATGEELLRAAHARQRHPDDRGRRRVPEHAARQQQSLQPGQRNHLARLGAAGRQPRRLPLLQADDRVSQGAPVHRAAHVLA